MDKQPRKQLKLCLRKKNWNAAEIKRKTDEKLLLESIYKRNKTVGKLEKDLESAEKSYTDAHSDAESMQKVLKDATKKGATGPAISEIVKSFKKLREKWKWKKVDELRLEIASRKSNIIKSVIKKKGLTDSQS